MVVYSNSTTAVMPQPMVPRGYLTALFTVRLYVSCMSVWSTVVLTRYCCSCIVINRSRSILIAQLSVVVYQPGVAACCFYLYLVLSLRSSGSGAQWRYINSSQPMVQRAVGVVYLVVCSIHHINSRTQALPTTIKKLVFPSSSTLAHGPRFRQEQHVTCDL